MYYDPTHGRPQGSPPFSTPPPPLLYDAASSARPTGTHSFLSIDIARFLLTQPCDDIFPGLAVGALQVLAELGGVAAEEGKLDGIDEGFQLLVRGLGRECSEVLGVLHFLLGATQKGLDA